jgi:hypothetical protein
LGPPHRRAVRYPPGVPESPPPHFLLIAVLHSTLPLGDALAMRLYQAALELHRGDEELSRIHGDLATGEVRQLRRTMALGSIVGPGFEAEIDTPRGSGRVRFVLTRQGLEAADADEARGGGAAPN